MWAFSVWDTGKTNSCHSQFTQKYRIQAAEEEAMYKILFSTIALYKGQDTEEKRSKDKHFLSERQHILVTQMYVFFSLKVCILG